MAQTLSLDAQTRDVVGRKIRTTAEARIPAVLYGHGIDNQNLWVERTPFMRTFGEAGENTVITLTVGKTTANVLVHDYQLDPISNDITHIDFFQVRMDETVDTDIPVATVGESDAIKTLGGTLTTLDTIPVRALPGDLPSEATIDLSKLATFDDTFTVGDLDFGDKVEILIAPETTIASVTPPRTQEEVDAADEEIDADVSKVEDVDAEKKDTEEGDAEKEAKPVE